MLNKSFAALLMAAAVLLSACDTNTDTYPILGEECGPEDPVK